MTAAVARTVALGACLALATSASAQGRRARPC